MRSAVMLGEIEEGILRQQLILEAVALGRLIFQIGRHAAAAIDGSTAVSQLHFVVVIACRIVLGFAVVVVVIQRNSAVVALDEPAAGSVVLGSGQGEAGVVGKLKYSLHQTLAERGFAHD